MASTALPVAPVPKKDSAIFKNRFEDCPAEVDALKPTYTHVPRLEPGSPEMVAYLKEHGYCVVKSVLSSKECEKALDLTWQYLEGLGTGIDRNDYKTWNDDRWPTVVHGGILPGHGIGQSAPQWYVRSQPRVQAAFEGLWGTKELLVSFDGMALFRPWKLNSDWKTKPGASWFHIDQHPVYRPGLQCVQGLVSMLPMSKASGGNVLIPKSHNDFSHITEKYPDRIKKLPSFIDHFRYPANDPLLQASADQKPIMCHMEAGDMLLWDSRTVHCSSPSLEDPQPQAQLMRAASLVCFMPKSRTTNPEVFEKRKAAVKGRKSTTNWTDVWVPIDEESPQLKMGRDWEKFPDTDGFKYNLIPEPQLTPEQMRLVGFSEEEIQQQLQLHSKL